MDHHLLVNNAGIAVMGNIDGFRLEDFDRTVALNLRAVFVATQAIDSDEVAENPNNERRRK